MLRDKIEGMLTQPTKVEKVGEFYIKMMTGFERSGFDIEMSNLADEHGKEYPISHIRGIILAATLCDENGKKLYELSDGEKLSKLPIDFVEPLFEASRKLNKLMLPEEEKIKGGESLTQ